MADVKRIGKAQYLPLGLKIDGDLTFEQWRDIGTALRDMRDNVMWWLGDWWNHGERAYGEMASQEAKEEVEIRTGYRYQTVQVAAWVADRFPYEQRVDGASWRHHRIAAAIDDVEIRARLMHEAVEKSYTIVEMENACRPYTRKGSERERGEAGLFDDDKFTLLYADPPWKYEFTETKNRKVENHYDSMELHAICNLSDASGKRIDAIVHDDCTLALWATAPKEEEAHEVINAWGFKYRTQIIWDKEKMGPGYYARIQHEMLLIAVRGEPGVPKPADRPRSVLTEAALLKWLGKKIKEAPKKKRAHSEKPQAFRLMLERMYPKTIRLEVFARDAAPGWSAWGNQTPDAKAKKTA